jgi:hypothetical protein
MVLLVNFKFFIKIYLKMNGKKFLNYYALLFARFLIKMYLVVLKIWKLKNSCFKYQVTQSHLQKAKQ